MLIWDEPGAMPHIHMVTGLVERRVILCSYESYASSVNRTILRDRDLFGFAPNKLSAAMIGAFRALGGRVADCVETSYAQWAQYGICALQAVARRSRAATAKPLTVTPDRAVRRVKAFFVSQKVNGRNAP